MLLVLQPLVWCVAREFNGCGRCGGARAFPPPPPAPHSRTLAGYDAAHCTCVYQLSEDDEAGRSDTHFTHASDDGAIFLCSTGTMVEPEGYAIDHGYNTP